MANGKRFDMKALTAAHKKLPLGSCVLVTNPKTDKSVVVEITDRGPYKGRRVIDLSMEAARRIGLLELGVGDVYLEVLGKTNGSDCREYRQRETSSDLPNLLCLQP